MTGAAQGRKVPLAERLASMLGAALVLAALGYMGWYAVAYDRTPPQLSIDVLSVEPSSGGYLVRFEVANEGTTTAEDLLIGGLLRSNGQVVEESEASLPFVPAHSRRGGGLLFRENPSQHELTVRPKGYSEP